MARFPSTQALRALECFSRHGTVWQTAEELNLTRSAISHQLRLLERDLGFRLLNRIGTSVKLTPQGAAYAADVRKALDAITGSAARNAGRGVSGALTVSCTPGFAASWLGPKIGRFRDACPDVELSIVTPRRLDDVTSPEVDVFIAFGTGNAPEMEVELLVEVEFTPLCSPTLLNRLGGLAAPSDVLRAGLLHLAHADDWRVWFNAAGLAEEAADTGIFFADMNLVYAAALHSQGIAMGDEFICRAAMETGQLVRPFDVAIPSPRSYFLMIAPEKTGNPVVAAFNDWIKGELRP
ncbi:MAG: LysR substrate-binding domain-containing protein [Albidovulum sp.]